MKRWITKSEIVSLVKGRDFKSEEELKYYLVGEIPELLGVKESQIETEAITTSFDYSLSNRADIIIRSDDGLEKVLLVIELKLSRSIEKYDKENYLSSCKQLFKYCQDTRAPYGILLTDQTCFIFENKYFAYNQKPKRVEKDILPSINRIEDRLAFYSLLDFLLYKNSPKYFLFLILFLASVVSFVGSITSGFGIVAVLTISTIIWLIVGLTIAAVLKIFKVFD